MMTLVKTQQTARRPLTDAGDIPDKHTCKNTGGLSAVTQPDQVVQKTLVERFARGEL